MQYDPDIENMPVYLGFFIKIEYTKMYMCIQKGAYYIYSHNHGSNSHQMFAYRMATLGNW